MTHRCAARMCTIDIDDVRVLCGRHEDKAGRSLHLALMAAQNTAASRNEIRAAAARMTFDKRMIEAQQAIDGEEPV